MWDLGQHRGRCVCSVSNTLGGSDGALRSSDVADDLEQSGAESVGRALTYLCLLSPMLSQFLRKINGLNKLVRLMQYSSQQCWI
ncbi:hypothetical protein P3T43_001358 [Paraburkholderia sp. GAS41]|jgi:hypothetical protein